VLWVGAGAGCLARGGCPRRRFEYRGHYRPAFGVEVEATSACDAEPGPNNPTGSMSRDYVAQNQMNWLRVATVAYPIRYRLSRFTLSAFGAQFWLGQRTQRTAPEHVQASSHDIEDAIAVQVTQGQVVRAAQRVGYGAHEGAGVRAKEDTHRRIGVITEDDVLAPVTIHVAEAQGHSGLPAGIGQAGRESSTGCTQEHAYPRTRSAASERIQ